MGSSFAGKCAARTTDTTFHYYDLEAQKFEQSGRTLTDGVPGVVGILLNTSVNSN